ncbi:penicillin-binding protein 1A [Azovibrio restrictus]|uniref:penicillin-binding protein 1A n=1 Tax=Azovibrio restrictus TaxID=146938 RepID=UPI001FDEB90E|nr:penicillin-binding protein 1A [Azovibrio restrictus]
MGIAIILIILVLAYPNLPSLEVLTDYRPKVPLRVFTSDGHLIGEFGEERRAVVKIQEVPEVMKQAILAAEDERFYQHGGVDTLGVLRAAYANFIGGGKRQGASTITMQVARNFFLSSEKTLTRKMYEALLSFKIEHNLSKDQIFELYINQIFLGQRAYGFAAAAQIYFGKPLAKISVAEAAMLAGLPKAPSAFNPVVNPKRARIRQEYVLKRMRELSFITEEQYQAALGETLVVKRDAGQYPVHAEYVAEMARQIAAERFPDEVYSAGLQVITSISKDEQEAAYRALRKGVLDYDRRQGYRGAEAYIDLKQMGNDMEEALDVALQEFPSTEDLLPAVVLEASPKMIKAYIRGGETITLEGEPLKFAARMLDDKAPVAKKIRRGAVIRVIKQDKHWLIAQLPEVEAAFVATHPKDGAIRALVGGFDFNRNMYNHVTQAWRQPGSSFKPFIYSAALEKGFSPGSIVADEPIVISSDVTGSQAWQPKNYDGKYDGPMKLRTALAKSKNMVSIRILQAMGPAYAQDYVTRFGFDAQRHPPYLTMALGAGSVTPWQMASAYAVFANGGYRINPYVVKEIRDQGGRVLAQATPAQAGDENLRAIDPRNAYLMYSMLRDVTIYGTAGRASATLKRHDLAGKTGTTNDYLDAWFCGFQQTVVGCAWVGFDQPRKLGSRETGGFTALPIWIAYMQEALKGVPEQQLPQPEGIATAQGDIFYSENTPPARPDPAQEEGLPAHEPPVQPPPKPTVDPFPSD